MATTVGTESSFPDLVRNLIVLEHDAVAAYEACINRLSEAAKQEKIREFLGDHHRHLDELNKIATEIGVDAPMEGDMKQYLTTGKVAMAQIMGDGAVLKAMKTNEDDTVAAYERAKTHDDAPPEARGLFERAHEDELRHRSWMESAA